MQSKFEPASLKHRPEKNKIKKKPADLVTYGIAAADLLKTETWCIVLSWLPQRSMWPQVSGPQDLTAELTEENVTTLRTVTITTLIPEIEKFSFALRLL